MTNDQREIHRKNRVMEYAEQTGNIHKTCRYFGVARSTFYLWRERYREHGDEGLKRRRCRPASTLVPSSRCRIIPSSSRTCSSRRMVGSSGRFLCPQATNCGRASERRVDLAIDLAEAERVGAGLSVAERVDRFYAQV